MFGAFNSVLRSSSEIRRPPGPEGFNAALAFIDFMKAQIPFFTRMARTHGDLVFYRLGPFPTYQVGDPELIEEVLIRRHASFHKDALTHELDELLGQGLLTSEGEVWRRHRRLAAPALTRRQIARYAEAMVDFTGRTVAGWANGELRDLHAEHMALTLRIVVKTLFNLELDDRVAEIGQALETAMEYFHKMAHTPVRYVPEQVPLRIRRENDRATAYLDEVIYDLIARRRAADDDGDDLLRRLIDARDDDGARMNDRQLRDEAMTMFLAGHETTALALTYTWHLLSHHPEAARRLYDEVDRVLAGRDATVDDLEALAVTRATVLEAMRLYPPAWIIGREAVEDVELGGYTVPRGSQVLMAQSVVHRDERWFPEPHAFRPERWLDGLEQRLPRFAYFPFGGGPRICIGQHFALMEAILVIATTAQQVEMTNASVRPLQIQPSVTLRPVTPVRMCVRRR